MRPVKGEYGDKGVDPPDIFAVQGGCTLNYALCFGVEDNRLEMKMSLEKANQHASTLPSPSVRYVLVIDLGTGGAKTAIVSDAGEVIASAKEPVSTHLLPHGGVEQDPHEWWDSTKKSAKRVVLESGVHPDQIVAVACDSQYSVIVPVDAHGDSLMNAVHWTDTRGGKYNRKINKGFPSVEGYGLLKALKWVKLTGLAPTHSGICCLGHILFIKNERPDIMPEQTISWNPWIF